MRILKAFSVVALACAVTMSIGCGDDSSSSSADNNTNNMAGTPSGAGGAATGMNAMSGGTAATPEPMGPSTECAEPATHSVPAGDYSPASRISELGIPKNVNEAKTAGCISVGANQGTGLSTLLALAGDLNSFVQKNDQGEYELLLLAHMTGWAAGEAASSHKLQLFVGEMKDDKFYIDLDSFNEKDATKGVKLEFDATVDECNVTTQTGTFALDIAIAGGLDIKLTLTSTTIRGQVAGNEKGFALSDTTISGYLSSDDVINLVNGLKTACASEDAPDLCATANPIIGADDAVDKVVNLMKGYDTKLENGTPAECDKKTDGDCNAVSVCLQVGSEAASIAGLSDD